MSTPANPLDQYQQYSYHHFLIAATNTEVLRKIENETISFSSLSGLKHGEKIGGGNDSVVMIVNSAVDSKFFIDSLSYTSYYVNVKDSDAKMTTASELDMVIRETGGATFINFLRKVSDEYLKTSYNSCCFLLKTFFVGHGINGKTTVYQTPPITLLMGNMDSSFDYSGGVHTIKFYGMSNGAPLKSGNMHYVNRNLNLVTNENSILLKDLVADFEKKLNDLLEKQLGEVQAQTGGNGRRVRYKFTLPKEWDNYKVKSTSKDNFVERLFEKEKQANAEASNPQKNQDSQNKPGIEQDRFKTNINTAVKTTVTQILSEIFKHCDEIHKDFLGNQELGPDKQHLAKLHQVVTSVTSDEKDICVHFDTVLYYLPKLPSDEEKKVIEKVTEQNLEGNKDKQFDKYGITFDYIFTGKNTDILSLDMKANHTNTILIANQTGIHSATNNMTATDKSVKAASSDQAKVVNNGKKVVTTLPMRKYDAVYLPDSTADDQHGYIYKAPESAELQKKYVNMLALLMANTTSNLHLTIRGNPAFMIQQVRPLYPHSDSEYEQMVKKYAEDAKAKAEKLTGEYNENESVSFMASPTYLPQFVRVNIMTPVTDEKTGVTTLEPFWYRGRYRVTSIKNHFQQGSFTQELFLLPYDLKALES